MPFGLRARRSYILSAAKWPGPMITGRGVFSCDYAGKLFSFCVFYCSRSKLYYILMHTVVRGFDFLSFVGSHADEFSEFFVWVLFFDIYYRVNWNMHECIGYNHTALVIYSSKKFVPFLMALEQNISR